MRSAHGAVYSRSGLSFYFSLRRRAAAAIWTAIRTPGGRAGITETMLQSTTSSVETRDSWIVAAAALAVMAVAFGAPWITVVALKDIAAEVGGERSIPSFAGAMVWIGSGVGGIVMGRVAERVGVRRTVIGGSVMIAVGIALSTLGPSLPLFVGQGVFVGLFGIGSINAPFYVYISRWFDRRRGSALALISSGSFLSGAVWPTIFERLIAYSGWRHAMLYYAVAELAFIVPAAVIALEPPPESPAREPLAGVTQRATSLLGWPPNMVYVLQACAIFTCCVPMSMPQAHLVAFCSDLGISPVQGAAMLSVLLGMAFLSRQVWGALADRVGGLYTMVVGSACQTVGLAAFLLTQNEIGLFTVSAAFGFGFSGLVPANILATSELYPADQAYWRIPTLLFAAGAGWRRAAGSAASFTIISAITRPLSPPAWPSA